MSGLWLVDVAVPVPLRQSFTYRIPENLEPDRVLQGHRILVPFRGKLIYGVTLTGAYEAGEVLPRGLRRAVSYDHRQQILALEIRELTDWITRYYRAPIGEVVKLCLPPGLLSEKEILFRLTAKGKELARDGGLPRELDLLSGKSLTRKNWETLAQAEISFTQIRLWEDQDLLELAVPGKEKESIPHETVFTVSDEGKTVDPEVLKRAPKQQELLLWLRDQNTVRSEEMGKKFKNGTSLANELVKKGFCIKMRIPSYKLDQQQQDFEPDEVKILTAEQDAALESLTHALEQRTYRPFLLFGVTGAGKTEVYLRAIQHCLQQGRQALFLVPEIGLTPLMQRRITDRFGERLAILHSAVSMGQRTESWSRILAGRVDVVLGARSGIFAPLPRLGLVIVDEEHDQSYKQNDGIRYHARDLALVRAKMAGATVVLGSATPSLESWQNHRRGRIKMLEMRHRATQARLPTVEVVDMREEFKIQKKRPIISRLLDAKMEFHLERGRQVMILLNRRGFHSFLLCRKCGEAVMCSQCEVTLTYHRTDNRLKCHYCNETRALPQQCPSCSSAATMMQFFGEGTQQLQELLSKRFPNYVVDRLDRDRLGEKDAHQRILGDFGANRSQILVGTQMIAKGHDFPNVTLVGIVNGDMGLRVPDFRGAELVFQLITQVAGRSGRGDFPGSVVIQTYMPEHYSITTAAKHDFPAFLEREIRYRENLFYPPFAYMVAILITHKDHDRAHQTSLWMAAQLQRYRDRGELVILGPAKAPIGRIKGAWRYQLVLKGSDRNRLQQIADAVVEEVAKRRMVPRQAMIMDIDPYQFF